MPVSLLNCAWIVVAPPEPDALEIRIKSVYPEKELKLTCVVEEPEIVVVAIGV